MTDVERCSRRRDRRASPRCIALLAPAPKRETRFGRAQGATRPTCDAHFEGLAGVTRIGDGTYAAIKPLLFHWTLLRGDFDDLAGYFDRWCFADEALARAALESFPEAPPAGWEPAGWHRHPRSGRRRPEGRPEAEYLEP